MHIKIHRNQHCFNTVSPTETYYFLLSRDWQYSNSYKLEAVLKIAIHRLQRRPAWYGKRTAVFYWWAKCRCMRVPSQVCCGKVALRRARLRVGAYTDRLASPCQHRHVSSLRPRVCLVGRTMAPSQLQIAPDKKTKRAFWTLPFGTISQSFFLCTKLQKKPAKKSRKLKVKAFSYGRTVGYKVRSSRPSAGKFLASPHARDVEPRPTFANSM